MRGRAASQSPIERVTCAGSGTCVGPGVTLLTGVAMRKTLTRVLTSPWWCVVLSTSGPRLAPNRWPMLVLLLRRAEPGLPAA